MVWKLEYIFKNKKDLESFSKNLEKECKDFKSNFENNLSNLKENEFLKAIITYENILEKITKIESYTFLCFAKDNNESSFYAKYEDICSKLQENLLFFEIEFNELDEKKQSEFIKFCTKYSYYLSNLLKQKAHQLSKKEERIMLRTKNIGVNAFSRLFDETFTSLNFKFNGENLKEEEILSKLSDNDRNIRKKASLTLSKKLKENSKLLTYIYNMIRKNSALECELRNYKYPEEMMHEYNQISKISVDNLINSAQNSFNLVHDFYKKKREILGYKTLYDYDRYAPLQDNGKYDYEKSKSIVLKAFENFNPKFASIAKHALENGFVDVMPSKTKISGAFSHSVTTDAHPYVLLNHTNKLRDLFTMAHELGHLIHQKLAYSVGFLNSQTPLTTAETASVFCEMIVFDYIKKDLKGEEKLSLYASKLEDIFATLYRQINFTTFEREIHAKKDELSTDEINQIWLKESKKMFGNSLKLNEYYSLWWSYIPHFIHTPFYCYSYAYAQLLVLALFGLYKSGKCKNFIELYTEFLSSGGSMEPRELIGKFNLDINNENFWQIGINEIKKLVNEFKGIKC
ncbi:putative oligoendopeptidase F [Campylobacter sputorum subsp. bubulus]|uniref:Putative oligoendopeptidase F n=1 Tax=Campylobacter sputorum subsp. sputorum TaxID=32024 RepID=A0A381DH03_9BACT|nr:M3 family oligoendopeptidase [Campylobacter sputorum]ASM35050.1 oligoendopeptidase F [Campylobacter sputorum aubsp. sputorum RM3237]KAB0581347.1 M3 family oligoendopeptidase [Campylobacter sputorum subsp. sputorum]QEL05240.1 oligoendopeptidase F [Campylobacter sputorum subsp. sputorum]SUX08960.1 putative oligoendopeptidase F [Campylobacter sputorum subsp. bubulus]SUX09718.1 putative oligoendopeptidase F [Campylobacter sputorum subsp. sputorum]